MLKAIITLFCTFTLWTGIADAKSSKRVGVRSKKIKSDANLSKNKVTLQFENQWFHGLSKKQQRVYLKTLNKLVLKMSSGGRSAASPFMNLFIESADAVPTLNIGYIYDTSEGFQNFINRQDFGDLNKCPRGQNPCAIYTCMRRTSGGEMALCCGTNSTPACVKQGQEKANQDLLLNTLRRCKLGTGDECRTIRRLMEEGTKGVEAWCNQGKRATREWCIQAKGALAKAGVATPPAVADPPEGENCEKVADELVRRKQQARKPETVDAGDAHTSNNPFWRQMTTLAMNVCGRRSLTQTTPVVGICNIEDMAAPGVGATVRDTRTFNFPGSEEVNNGFWGACVRQKLDDHEARLNKIIDRIRKDTSIPANQLGAKINEARRKNQDQRAVIQSRYNSGAVKTCTMKFEGRESVAGSPRPASELGEDLIEKVKKSKALSTQEENEFKAVTGLSAGQFRRAFCNSKNHEGFKSAAATIARAEQPPVINERVGSEVALRQAASAARASMRACLQELKSVEESDCKYHDITDPNAIRNTSNDQPILAKNKLTGMCVLVTGYEKPRVNTGFNDDTGNSESRIVERITWDNLKSGGTDTMSPAEFENSHFLKDYRCTHDVSARATYRQDSDAGDGPEGSNSEL